MSIQQQCAARYKQRIQQQEDKQIIKALIRRFEVPQDIRIKRALNRLPANASYALQKQVIREAVEDE